MDAAGDDAALAARIAGGDDAQAEAMLCRRWLPRVRAYGRVHLRDADADAAADLAQEVLVIVIRALRERRVNEGERLAAYVSGVCRNVTRDWKKGERRRAALLDRFGPAWAQIAQPAPAVDRAQLARCLQSLSARGRAVVVLTYFGDKDGDEIARELGMSSGNVRVTRHRALEQLLECMGGGP
jgi:RNA polymerase sigma factor (sigma-70 family)